MANKQNGGYRRLRLSLTKRHFDVNKNKNRVRIIVVKKEY